MLKECVDLDILGETFDSKMTFKKHFTRFEEQLLKGLVVSLASLREYFVIDCFLGDGFGVLSCPFWSTVL